MKWCGEKGYIATTAAEFRRLMTELQSWSATQTWPAAVPAMLSKLRDKTDDYATAYDHPDCHRTSNLVDRLMNRMYRLMYAGRGLHGHQCHSELRLRGWALLLNFRPFAPRAGTPREHQCPLVDSAANDITIIGFTTYSCLHPKRSQTRMALSYS